MYFSTFNTYFNEDSNNMKKAELVCIICWENEGIIEDLQLIVKNSHMCRYGGKFHNKCLYKWFNKNNYCPMCREKVDVLPIIKNDTKYKIQKILNNTINVLLFCLKYYNFALYILFFCFILYTLFYV